MKSATVGRECCLFLDVDGTLIDIAARPEAVIVPASLVSTLDRLSRRLDHAVALISGRTIENLDGLFRPLRLTASGVHGAEVRFSPEGLVTHEANDALDPALIDTVQGFAADQPGVLVEDKRFSVAVHYRLAPHAGPVVQAMLEGLVAGTQDPDLRLLTGHMVFEIKRATFDKGLAVRRFMARPPFAGRTPVFLGDDVTDRPGFAATVELGGEAYGVGGNLPGTTGTFSDPASVRSWLASFAEETTHA